ncbi:hypothetical protein BJ994_002013 [Arthrobacter pigmenti]|uniref:GerMN domain-containing protein n=1 Tax=Arthrobacter pigmenti TaxID=271432 RepID=A0A846RS01_9MICC|nr:hypothetical protein [Arthrobacter pigmenti]
MKLLRNSRFVIALALLGALTACSSIPTAGPIGTIEATAEAENDGGFVNNPPPPREGSSAAEVLEGFLFAGVGVSDNFSVAREYLTPALAQTWEPEEEITIYRSDPIVSPTPTDGQLQLQVEVAGYIDAAGIRSNVPAGSTESLSVRMERVEGEWRVAEIPNGIMISTADAVNLLQSHELYFYSSTSEFWVPDVRWFVNRQGIASNIAQALINGPAPYLQGAVISAFPENAALAVESVPIESGTATVDLTEEILDSTDDLQRQQMEQQLEVTLTALDTVNSVELRSGTLSLADSDANLNTIRDQAVGSQQVAISENELVYLEGGALRPVEDVPSIATLEPIDPAMSYGSTRSFAFLNAARTQLFATGEGEAVRTVLSGSNLTAPSFDPTGWLWTAGTSNESSYVRAIPPGGNEGDAVQVLAPWLGDRTISEIRISRDGARALIVSQQSGQSQVLLSGVSRTEEGVPQSLSEPISLDASGPVNAAKWVSETSVLVAQTSSDDPVVATLIPFAGDSTDFQPPQDETSLAIEHISAGSGTTALFAQSAGSIWQLVGSTWNNQDVPARDPAFPG